eukprot:c8859_g1_i3.p1 GENE.c8859_g1_i3~~c8859_g1_i3.p1  ORF type:complete len:125 (-),score=28.13 c8859_g1_i3:269-643(-)
MDRMPAVGATKIVRPTAAIRVLLEDEVDPHAAAVVHRFAATVADLLDEAHTKVEPVVPLLKKDDLEIQVLLEVLESVVEVRVVTVEAANDIEIVYRLHRFPPKTTTNRFERFISSLPFENIREH